MDVHRFDTLTRGFANAASRRALTATLAAGALAALLARHAPETTAKKKKRGKKRKKSPVCTPACTGKNRICVGGACVCRSGTKECPNGLGHCHECCQDFGGAHDDECVGHPGGQYCDDFNNDQVMECGCLPGQQNCGDGKCVACCTTGQCPQNGDDPRICVGGGCVCDEANGWRECVVGIWKDHCRHIDDDPEACGANCVTCSTSPDLGQICQGGKCCLPSGKRCDNAPQNCCSPFSCVLNQEGTAFVCG